VSVGTDARARALLFGALLLAYAVAIVVAGVHGELLAGAVVVLGLTVRVAACRRTRQAMI